MDIGHRMKELRIQYGLTQQELADRAELTKGFISQLERNQNSPSVGTLLDIIQQRQILRENDHLHAVLNHRVDALFPVTESGILDCLVYGRVAGQTAAKA